MSLPLPEFYESKQVSQLFLERGGLVAEAGEAYAKKHAIKPAGQDKFRIAAFGIDVQVGFCTPGASLFVPGAVEAFPSPSSSTSLVSSPRWATKHWRLLVSGPYWE